MTLKKVLTLFPKYLKDIFEQYTVYTTAFYVAVTVKKDERNVIKIG